MTDVFCNPFSALMNLVPKKPIALILPAALIALSCGPTYVATLLTKTGCDGDKVSVAANGWADWAGPKGDVKFQVLNTPTPKTVCVVKLDKTQAAQFAASQTLSWDDFNRWKNT